MLVSLDREKRAALPAIVHLAREWEWDLLDLELTRGSVPTDPLPSGALVGCLPSEPLVRRLREMGCPAVRVGTLPHPRDDLLPAVLPDQAAAGRMAVDHFVERGFKYLANVGSKPWSLSRPLHEAFRARARELGLEPFLFRFGGEQGAAETPAEHAAKFERRVGEIGEWLSGLPKPVAVLTYSDWRAARLCIVCHRVGLSVPDDVALLGVGNHQLTCELSPVVLSSIDPDAEEQGRRAAQLLRGLMAGESAPLEPIMVPPCGIVERRSTEVRAVHDPRVARAMRFMWDHLDQNLSVGDVAAEIGMPRRSLERAFKEQLGRGVSAELCRKRLERCCELLKTTDLPIRDLVPLCGFRSADYLHAVFRKAFGTSPRKWRVARMRNDESGEDRTTVRQDDDRQEPSG